MRLIALAIIVAPSALLMTDARGAIQLSLVSAGEASAIVAPGTSVQLDLSVTGAVGDGFDSAITRLEFSAPGLRYLSYAWQAPFANSSGFDGSVPANSSLPLTLSAATLEGTGYPVGVIDIELSNLTGSGVFGSGVLVSLTFQVPLDWAGPGTIQITPVADTFANGFSTKTVSGATPFLLTIPSPAALPCLAATLLVARRRHRRVG